MITATATASSTPREGRPDPQPPVSPRAQHLRRDDIVPRAPSHPNQKLLRGRAIPFSCFAPPTHKEPVTMSTLKKLALAALTFSAAFLVPLAAFAQDDRAGSNKFDVEAYAAIGAGIAIGLAVLGGALGQGRAAAAALEGISRNPGESPRIQTPMILGLALIESLVLIAFVIAFWLKGVASP